MSSSHPIAIIVHGGAGRVYSDDLPEACTAGCGEAAEAGYRVLHQGGTAVDAVIKAAQVLEDNPQFNAGVGSTLNLDGDVETDALVMDGKTLRAGGVTGLRGFRNPIHVAERILHDSPHVLLACEGAARFARDHGIPPCPPAELVTERALRRWHKERDEGWPRRPGTIGAVAIDRDGNLAAATSTGGISGKLMGRVGDTPMIGGGTYADNIAGGASATGHGESIAKVVMAKVACDHMRQGGSAADAADEAVKELGRVSGEGGIIVISPTGEIGASFNSERMSRAWIGEDGQLHQAFGR